MKLIPYLTNFLKTFISVQLIITLTIFDRGQKTVKIKLNKIEIDTKVVKKKFTLIQSNNSLPSSLDFVDKFYLKMMTTFAYPYVA